MSYIYEKTEEQLHRARRLTRLAGRIALYSLLFGVALVIVGIICAPIVLNIKIPEIIYLIWGFAVLTGLGFSGGLACIGAATIRENFEARTYSGQTLMNPMSSGLRLLAFILFALPIVAIVWNTILAIQHPERIDRANVVIATDAPGGKESRYLVVQASGFRPNAKGSINFRDFPTGYGTRKSFSEDVTFDGEGKLDWKKTDIPLLKQIRSPDAYIPITVSEQGSSASASSGVYEKEFMSPN